MQHRRTCSGVPVTPPCEGSRHFHSFPPAATADLGEGYKTTVEPARTLRAESVKLEHEVSDLVNSAYGLTAEDVALMWRTAPPRMPLAKRG